MIKAAIFDVDGLLVDTEPLHYLAWKETLKMYGIRFEKKEFMKRFAGIGTSATAAYFAKKFRLHEDSLLKGKKEIYFNLIRNVEPMPGAKDVVKRFRKFMPVAAASSSRIEDVSPVLRKIGVLKLLDAVATGDEVKKLKPHPDVYLLAAKKLGMKPKFCVAFEDTSVGVSAAKAAGMFCIAVPNIYTKVQNFSKADMIEKSLKGINTKKFLIWLETIR